MLPSRETRVPRALWAIAALAVAGCTPHDAAIEGTYQSWLAANSSASVLQGDLDLSDATIIDCRNHTADPDRAGEISVDDLLEGSSCAVGELNPNIDPLSELGEAGEAADRPQWASWLYDDAFYVQKGSLDTWRSEAIITSEGDFQISFHHDLGTGQDFRLAFVVEPEFQPTSCVQSGFTCYNIDESGALTEPEDNDGDGWIDTADSDCFYGAYEVGFGTTVSGGVLFNGSVTECNDGYDNDGDGSIDSADSDCEYPRDDLEGTPDTSCTDGDDNDSDGVVDGDDPDCVLLGTESGDSNGLFSCSDGVDNDGDGATDLDDDSCQSAMDGTEDGPVDDKLCRDSWDSDGDGWVDGDDPDCDEYETEVGYSPAACNDGEDNDGDTWIDADDPGCVDALDPNEEDPDASCSDTCDDGDGNEIPCDNDGDGWVNEEDPDCIFGTAEDDSFFGIYECNDGIDNDFGGDDEDENTDADDNDCKSPFHLEVRPSSGTCEPVEGVSLDEDGDGWFDADDIDCNSGSREDGFTVWPCNDNMDNDGDGFVDAEDPDCLVPDQSAEDFVFGADCTDGTDNDGDGWTDLEDPSCWIGGAEAFVTGFECSDGIDNDGDGFTDGEDRGAGDDPEERDYHDCENGWDVTELSENTCEDGLDNDGDGWIDGTDEDCSTEGYEYTFAVGACQDGLDNDGDGLIDGNDDGCLGPSDPWEQDFDECADGIDNDSDGWLDTNDPDCLIFDSPFEAGQTAVSECNDGTDNDGDGDTDSADADCRNALDNIEALEDQGMPVAFPNDYAYVLEEWSEDEDGNYIWYLNATSFQINPADSEDYWYFPQEWLAGFAHAKYAAEEFFPDPALYSYLGDANNELANAFDPDPEALEEARTLFEEASLAWASDMTTYAGMDEYELKTEDNAWRPVDLSTAGLDLWVETQSSWVRVSQSSSLEEGGSAKGDFQITLQGTEAGSRLVVRGTFDVEDIKKDRWTYPVLEDELREENNTFVCE